MAPVAINAAGQVLNGFHADKVDTMNPHDLVNFDPKLTPKRYEIKGTDPESQILIKNVNIIDSSGADPYTGDILIKGNKIVPILVSSYS